jgi:hypothetical protein
LHAAQLVVLPQRTCICSSRSVVDDHGSWIVLRRSAKAGSCVTEHSELPAALSAFVDAIK